MPETKLPPGPWRVDEDEGVVLDAAGQVVMQTTEDEYYRPVFSVSPDVLRAIEALPELVAAARKVVELNRSNGILLEGEGWFEVPRRMGALREALALIDGPKCQTGAPK